MSVPSPQPVPPNPYVGPIPFVEGQTLHGRRRETQALADLLIGKRVVLLIAPSGAGKTSLIQAALLPRLRARLDPLPIVRLGRAPEEQGTGVNRYLLSTLASLESALPEGQRLPVQALARYTLAAYLSERAGGQGREPAARFRLLVLDQFEELFTLDRLDWADKEAFLVQLGEALGGGSPGAEGDGDEGAPVPSPPLWALISMREDYVAELEPFLHLIPSGLGFRYRLEPLEREQAIEAATAPAGGFVPRGAAERLVDDLRSLTAAPEGGGGRRLGRFVEPVQLQVVCLRLWDKVVADQGRTITAGDIVSDTHGNAVDAALGAYYDSVVALAAAAAGTRQRELRDWVETRLISHTKMRTRVLRERGLLDRALDVLVERYLLRMDLAGEREWLELSHDRLVDPVLVSNEAWRAQNLALFQRQAKLWAETGRTDDMLFSGDELAEAQRFAAGHPESLSDDDRLFLEKSREVRERAEAERDRLRKIEQQAREIALKNEVIRAKNRRLRTWRLWLGILGAFALISLGWALVNLGKIQDKNAEIEQKNTDLAGKNSEIEQKNAELTGKNTEIEKKNTQLHQRELFGRLKQATALARGGAPAEGLANLIAIAEEIVPEPANFLQLGLDQGLIEALGNHSPSELQLRGHDHIVRALRFSRDGGHLFSGGWDDRLKTWSIHGTTGTATAHEEHDSDIRSLAYHAGRQLLVSADDVGSILVWSVKNNLPRLLRALNRDGAAHQGAVWTAAISPDGMQLATAGKDKRIVLWDLNDPANPVRLGQIPTRFHETGIYRLAFLQQGLYKDALVSGDWNGKVGIWRAPVLAGGARREPDLRFTALDSEGRPVAIFGLAASPDGRWVAVGDHQGGVRAWDLESSGGLGEERRFPYFESHRAQVNDMDFSDDSSTLVTVDSDGVLLRWSIPTLAQSQQEFYKQLGVQRFRGWGEKLYSVAFRPGSSRRVAVGGGKSIWIADLSRPNPLAAPIGVSGPTPSGWSAVSANSELSLLAALDLGGKIHRWRWDGAGYVPLPPMEGQTRLDRIALSPDGDTLAGLTCAGKLVVYSFAQDRASAPQVFDELKADVFPGNKDCAIAFAPGGRSFATVLGRTLRLWSPAESGDWQGTGVQEAPGTLLALSFSPDGTRLAGGGRFDRLLVWPIADGGLAGPPTQSIESFGESVSVLVFDPTGQMLVSGADNAVATAWAVPELGKVTHSGIHGRRLTAFAGARRLGESVFLSGDEEGQLVLCWKEVDERHCARLGGPSGKKVKGLAANADLTRLIVADDGLWVWDLSRNSMLEALQRLAP
ncbi:MAG: hypothetical protein WAM94_15040 [Chromatiaceae bacterium]